MIAQTRPKPPNVGDTAVAIARQTLPHPLTPDDEWTYGIAFLALAGVMEARRAGIKDAGAASEIAMTALGEVRPALIAAVTKHAREVEQCRQPKAD
ncbi:MAG: hypothetical protein KY475_07985 [Planctomycetes bacterium]|nr:hypothetical protein [Planctomycetota bacterium]